MEATVPTDSLDELARRFRSAIVAGDHESALRWSTGYVAALQSVWENLPADKRQQARDLMEWARQATMIHRTMAAEQLAVIRNASRYHPATAVPHMSFTL
jgi:hypothetical protein